MTGTSRYANPYSKPPMFDEGFLKNARGMAEPPTGPRYVQFKVDPRQLDTLHFLANKFHERRMIPTPSVPNLAKWALDDLVIHFRPEENAAQSYNGSR